MEELTALIIRARDGDGEAFGSVVRRFQDMAVGYGYSLLGDFQAAEDAAQEAFLEAYLKLDSLLEPAAFPGGSGESFSNNAIGSVVPRSLSWHQLSRQTSNRASI